MEENSNNTDQVNIKKNCNKCHILIATAVIALINSCFFHTNTITDYSKGKEFENTIDEIIYPGI